MFSSRAVFLLGTLIALVGSADAAVTTCTGSATGLVNTEANPGGSGVIACKCVLGYTAASGALVLGDVTLSCTKCASGYFFSAGDGTLAGATCAKVPAGKFNRNLFAPTMVIPEADLVANGNDVFTKAAHGLLTGDEIVYNQVGGGQLATPLAHLGSYFVTTLTASTFTLSATIGGSKIDITNDGHDLQFFSTPVQYDLKTRFAGTDVARAAPTPCPPNSASVAGSTVMADCKLNAGYHITTKSSKVGVAPTPSNVVAATANSYGLGGLAIDQQVGAAGLTTCPYGGTSAVGSDALVDCTPAGTPACGVAALKTLSQGGTCVCAATQYGVPLTSTDTTDGVPTKGCAYEVGQGGTADAATAAIATSAITTNTITIAHAFYVGQPLVYSATTPITGLTSGMVVFVNTVSGTTSFTISLASGGSIFAFAAGLGHNDQVFTPFLTTAAIATSAITTNTITIAHGFYVGQAIVY